MNDLERLNQFQEHIGFKLKKVDSKSFYQSQNSRTIVIEDDKIIALNLNYTTSSALEFVSNFTNLQYLKVQDYCCFDLAPLSKLPNNTLLDLRGSDTGDAFFIKELQKVKTVYVD